MKLIATQSFSYNTRRLQAGDIFEAKTNRDGMLLVAIKKARSHETRLEEEVAPPNKDLLNKVGLANGGPVKNKPFNLVGEVPSERTVSDEKIKQLEKARIIADQQEKERAAILAKEQAEKSKADELAKEQAVAEQAEKDKAVALAKEQVEKEEDKSSTSTQPRTRTRGRARGH